jgi:hypothetical protein
MRVALIAVFVLALSAGVLYAQGPEPPVTRFTGCIETKGPLLTVRDFKTPKQVSSPREPQTRVQGRSGLNPRVGVFESLEGRAGRHIGLDSGTLEQRLVVAALMWGNSAYL